MTGEARASAYLDREGKPRGVMEITARDVEFLTPRDKPSDEGVPAGMMIHTANSGFVEVEGEEFPF